VFLVAAFSTSCKKGRADFVLTGTITDGSFNTNLSGSKISLYEVPGAGQPQFLESISSADGSYSFTFERNPVESYLLIVEKENYFSLEQTIPFSDLTTKSENIRDYTTYAKSWAKLRFVNVDPEPGDQLKYIKVKGKSDCDECCSKDYITLSNISDTTFYCINNGNAMYSFNYWLLGTTISGSESVVTTPFDTVEILLEY
jgi:hypothetical protein